MSNPNGNQSKAPEPVKAASVDPNKPVFPVKKIVFKEPTDLPEKPVSDNVPTTPRDKVFDADGKRINSQKAYLVDYLPWLRHHRITYYPANRSKPPEERMVPESGVKWWEPA